MDPQLEITLTFAVVMETYVHGVSTRKVDDLGAALGFDAGRRSDRGEGVTTTAARCFPIPKSADSARSNDGLLERRPSLVISHWRSVEGNGVLPLWGMLPPTQGPAHRLQYRHQRSVDANASLQLDRRVMKWHR